MRWRRRERALRSPGAPPLRSPGGQALLLVQVADTADLDAKPATDQGWRATPHARLERLLRETGVPIGLLFNGTSLRLVYAPKHESSGAAEATPYVPPQ